jgi:hypothetical protein
VRAELGIEARSLALPESVQRRVREARGPQWIERFFRLCERLKPLVLPRASSCRPGCVARRTGCNIWRRNNLWMLFHALALNARR